MVERAWLEEPLVPRPGFGFYPDTVWNILEKLTEVTTVCPIIVSNFRTPMILVLNGSSKYDLHVCSKLCNLIC